MLKEKKKEIVDLLQGSTAYGVPNLFRSKHLFNKILWICFLLVASISSCYFIYSGILDFLEYKVITNVELKYDQPAEFPTVTICCEDGIDLNCLDQINNSRFGYDFSLNDELKNNLESFFNQQHGQCFRFNSGKNLRNHSIPTKNSTIGGRNDCLKIALNTTRNILVWIHQKNSPPKIEDWENHDNPIFISKGTRSNIVIEKTVDLKLDEPYNKCLKDASYFQGNKTIVDYILKTNQSYSQIKCLEYCFDLNYIHDKPCNCTKSELGHVWMDCWIEQENKTIDSCTFKYKSKFYKNNLANVCAEYCPLECDTVYYSVTENNYNPSDNFTTFIAYFRSLQYTLITQQPKMLTFDLISSIGGILGLFVGVSFVSLFEITEILMQITFIFLKKNLPFRNNNENFMFNLKNEIKTELKTEIKAEIKAEFKEELKNK